MMSVNPHPGGRAGKVGGIAEIHPFHDPLPGSNPFEASDPRVFVATAPRPGANLCDPCRDQEMHGGDPSLKASLRIPVKVSPSSRNLLEPVVGSVVEIPRIDGRGVR